MSHTITARQYITLRLYYVEGWSERRIGAAFSITHQAAHDRLIRARRWVFEAAGDEGLAASPLVEALLAPSPTSSPTSNVGVAASRQDELLDSLELLTEQHAQQAASFIECMSGDSHLPTHVKRNTFDQWEMRYAADHRCEQLPTSAYNANIAGGYCGRGMT